MFTKYSNHSGIPPQDIRVAERELVTTDYTGKNPKFRVSNEVIKKEAITNRCFALSKGAFFDESLHIRAVSDNGDLVRHADYSCKVLDTAATGAAGKEIHTVIQLADDPDSDLIVSYQYVGGKHLYQRETIIDLLSSVDDRQLDNIYYSQIKNRPYAYDVTDDHIHDASDIVGRDTEIDAMLKISESLDKMIANTSIDTAPVISYLKALIDQLAKDKQDVIDPALTTASKSIVGAINELRRRHISDHATVTEKITELETKHDKDAQEIRDELTQKTDALNQKVDENKEVTDKVIADLDTKVDKADDQLHQAIENHKRNTENPHHTTKTQVGLGNVNNWGATSEVTVDSPTLYATARAIKLVHDKAVEALNKSVTHWEYIATGGEDSIELPYEVNAVDSVIVQGIYQTKNRAWEFDKATNSVRLAETLVEEDEVIITLGSPAADVEVILSELQDKINHLESIVNNGGGGGTNPPNPPDVVTGPMEVFTSTFPDTMDYFSIPDKFTNRDIKIVFLQGLQQSEGIERAYTIDRGNNLIKFSDPIYVGTEITIVG